MAVVPVDSSTSGRQVAGAPSSSPSRAPFPASRSTTLMSLRAANMSLEADQALYLEPAALRTAAWMGGDRCYAVTEDTGAYHADPVKRDEARSERAKATRQMRAFVEDVETTLDEAGIPFPRGAPGVSPRSTMAGMNAFSLRSPMTNSTHSTAGSQPVSPARGSGSGSAGAAAVGGGRSSRGSAPASARRTPATSQQNTSRQHKSAAAAKQKAHDDEAERSRAVATLERSVNADAVANGKMLLSAYDGSAHPTPERLLDHNAFVRCRMVTIIDEEERQEATGFIFSAAQSVLSESGGGGGSAPSTPCGGSNVRGRRPAAIPPLSEWEKLPPTTDADGAALDASLVAAANRAYNDLAHTHARRLMAHRCFRRHDFVGEHEDSIASATAAAIDLCIGEGRLAGASVPIANAASVDAATRQDVASRADEIAALCQRWSKESAVRGSQPGDAQRFDPTSPTAVTSAGPSTPSEAQRAAAHRTAAEVCAAFIAAAALLLAEPTVANGPVDRWVRAGRIAALLDASRRAKDAVAANA